MDLLNDEWLDIEQKLLNLCVFKHPKGGIY